MDLQMYQKHAKRTLNLKLPDNVQLAALTLGIYGELGEVIEEFELSGTDHRKNLGNEMGDTFWYIANTCTVIGIDWTSLFPTKMETVQPYPITTIVLKAIKHSARVADCVKKRTAQGHLLDIDAVYDGLRKLVENLLALLDWFDLDLGRVLEDNHLKLLKRYPNGFESARSINREV